MVRPLKSHTPWPKEWIYTSDIFSESAFDKKVSPLLLVYTILLQDNILNSKEETKVYILIYTILFQDNILNSKEETKVFIYTILLQDNILNSKEETKVYIYTILL